MKNPAKDGVLIIAALMGAMAASPVLAEDFKTFQVVVDMGRSKTSDGCRNLRSAMASASTLSNWSCKDHDRFSRVALAYQFSPYVGVEVGYIDLGKLVASGSYPSANIDVNWKANGFDVLSVVRLPIVADLSAFAKAGISSTKAKLRVDAANGTASAGAGVRGASTMSTRLCLGLQYAFSESVAARLQYDDFGNIGDEFTTGTARVHSVGASLVYMF